MDEDVLAAIVRHHEAEAARGVVPFHHAIEGLRGSATLATAIARMRPRCLRRGGIDVDHGDRRSPLGALSAIECDCGTFRCLTETGALEHRQRQEYVAAPVRRDDEAK